MTITTEPTTGPARQALSVWRGDSLGMLVVLWADPEKTVPADLSEATVRSQVRATMTSTQAVDFDVTVVDNMVTLLLAPAKTQGLADSSVFDVQVDWHSDQISVQTVVAGVIAASGDVTR